MELNLCMVKIGLLSDTHGHVDAKMLKFFDSVDEIWHVGDIGNFEVIEKLQIVKPLKAVYGNIDDQKMRREYPLNLHFLVEQVKVSMTHIGGYPGNYAPGIIAQLIQEKPNLFIAGHSHILKVMFDKKYNCLYMNPGAAGISGFHQVRTMLRFTIDGSSISDLEVWEHPR